MLPICIDLKKSVFSDDFVTYRSFSIRLDPGLLGNWAIEIKVALDFSSEISR
jgi:hypothetical protein